MRIVKKVKHLTLEEVDKVCDYAHELADRDNCFVCFNFCPFKDIKYKFGNNEFCWSPCDTALSDTNGLGEKEIEIEEDDDGFITCRLTGN